MPKIYLPSNRTPYTAIIYCVIYFNYRDFFRDTCLQNIKIYTDFICFMNFVNLNTLQYLVNYGHFKTYIKQAKIKKNVFFNFFANIILTVVFLLFLRIKPSAPPPIPN
jgi:hypothetical protein